MAYRCCCWRGHDPGYARLYDGTFAADYYRAMVSVELNLQLAEDTAAELASPAMLLVLVNAPQRGTLNQAPRDALSALREGLLQLAESAHSVLERFKRLACTLA